jgi:hypothetical protein
LDPRTPTTALRSGALQTVRLKTKARYCTKLEIDFYLLNNAQWLFITKAASKQIQNKIPNHIHVQDTVSY